MDGCWATTCKACGHRYTWRGLIGDRPSCPKCNPRAGADRAATAATAKPAAAATATRERPLRRAEDQPLPQDAQSAIDDCESIIEEIENHDWPDAGMDFAESVRGKLRDMAATIEERRAVTDGQVTAIENMGSGVRRWTER